MPHTAQITPQRGTLRKRKPGARTTPLTTKLPKTAKDTLGREAVAKGITLSHHIADILLAHVAQKR